MKKHSFFPTAVLCLFLLFCLLLSSCTANKKNNTMTAVFYKIGKADAIFLQISKGETAYSVLVDTGEEDDGAELCRKLRTAGVDKLDFLILTHYDKDHIGGAPSVLSAIPAEHILMPDYTGGGEAYAALLESLKGQNTEILKADTAFSLGGAEFSVSVPKSAFYEKKQDNNSSLVVTVTHEGNTLLLAGDAERLRQEELLSSGILSPVTLLKVPHHGVYNQGIEDFFAACQPRYAVITCSEKNPPEEKTRAALEALGTQYYLTSGGDITVTSAQNGFMVSQ